MKKLRESLPEHGVSNRPVEFSVMQFSLSCIDDIVQQSTSAVQEDGADVIVMGCTGTGVDMAALVQERLVERVGVYSPVIDPVKAAIAMTESFVRSNLFQSKEAYPAQISVRPEYHFADNPSLD